MEKKTNITNCINTFSFSAQEGMTAKGLTKTVKPIKVDEDQYHKKRLDFTQPFFMILKTKLLFHKLNPTE